MNKKNIIHLDDHTICQQMVKDALKGDEGLYSITSFKHSATAIEYIKECREKKTAIDLIITDYAHEGEDGYEFAGRVKEWDIPVLLLTMHSPETNEYINKGLAEERFNMYCSKLCGKEELRNSITELIEIGTKQ